MLNLWEYLEKSASRYPEKIAFSDENRAFTFRQLLEFSLSCGTAIAKLAEQVNRPVAVLTDRTAISVAAFQSVLASGHYYVPVDFAMPPARMESILAQLNPLCLLYAQAQEPLISQLNPPCPALCLEQVETEAPDSALLVARRARVLDIDPAYAIFTSGSTGVPKGIVCHHRGVIDLSEWLSDMAEFTEADVLGNQAPFYFDGSVKDVYMTLKCGATCYILAKKLFMFPKLLVEELNQKKITALQWATSAFHLTAASGVLKQYQPQYLAKVLAGGEAMQARDLNLWRQALPRVRYINLYGPTETTVDVAWYEADREFAEGEPIPIGRVCRNKEILLLREDLQPAADGEIGEICVRGLGLAKGYFGDWDKTAAAFIQNPQNSSYPDRIYRTGDMGYWGSDGLLYFCARKDNQIKHMGYRIELGEVETALHGLSDIEEAICFFDQAQDKIVCVYQAKASKAPAGSEAQTASSATIAQALRKELPRYMQPNIYRRVEKMPYNANGKIDRVRLKREYEAEYAD